MTDSAKKDLVDPLATLVKGVGFAPSFFPSPMSVGPMKPGFRSSTILSVGRRTMKFRPLHDRVVVKRIEAEEKTAGGIIIPDTAKGNRAKSSRSDREGATRPASSFRSTFSPAIVCCSASGRAPKSRSMASNT
jgi:hypothetical protein